MEKGAADRNEGGEGWFLSPGKKRKEHGRVLPSTDVKRGGMRRVPLAERVGKGTQEIGKATKREGPLMLRTYGKN